MFNVDYFLKMMGVSKEDYNQLTTLKSMLDKLPKDKKVELIGNFIKDLEGSIKEIEDVKNK